MYKPCKVVFIPINHHDNYNTNQEKEKKKKRKIKRKKKKKKREICAWKKCHSTSNNRATELEAAVLIPHGLSHHNDYLFLTNGNSNLLILWLHFCGLTFHMSQETSASPPCLNPPLVKLITCVAHKPNGHMQASCL